MGETTVAVSSLGLAGTLAAALIWTLKYFLKKLSKDMQEHTKAAVLSAEAAKDQAASNRYVAKALIRRAEADESLKEIIENVNNSSHEQYLFMKKLNGKLEDAIKNKVEL